MIVGETTKAQDLYRWCAAIVSVVILSIGLMLPLQSYEPLPWFCKSFQKYNILLPNKLKAQLGSEYVFFNQGAPTQREVDRLAPKAPPHVFFVIMESFNRTLVEEVVRDREVTPFFNRLIEKGVFVENFYANSVYTTKGHEAILLGLYPTISASITEKYLDRRFKGLLSILRDHGYLTAFFQGHFSMGFNDTDRFAEKAGFDIVKSMDSSFVDLEDAVGTWGWGLQDDLMYQKVFDYLENLPQASDKPLFVTLATISHHQPFNKLPREQRKIVAEPKDKFDHFINSLHASDSYLRVFFEELEHRPRFKNSLVIVVGDHSYPVWDQKRPIETGFDEERFRVPLLLFWPDALMPKRIQGSAYSQVDIAPSVLDLLGIAADNHFVGRSLFSEPSGVAPALMVQPFGGRFLIAIDYSYKYVVHQATDRKLPILLKGGRLERILSKSEASKLEIFSSLEQSLDLLYVNEYLLVHDQVWP